MIKRIEAFVCESCGKISDSESLIKKCAIKHKHEEDFILIAEKFSNYLKDNLKQLNQLPDCIIGAGKLVGIDISIEKLKFKGLKLTPKGYELSNTYNSLYYRSNKVNNEMIFSKLPFDMMASFSFDKNKAVETNLISKAIKDKLYYFSALISQKDIVGFFRSLKGISIESGSSSVERCSYEICIDLSEFPHLYENLKQITPLVHKKELFLEEQKRLSLKFNSDLSKVHLIADISYQILLSNFEEISEQEKALADKLKDVREKQRIAKLELSEREKEVLETPRQNFSIPSEDFNYDKEEYSRLYGTLTLPSIGC